MADLRSCEPPVATQAITHLHGFAIDHDLRYGCAEQLADHVKSESSENEPCNDQVALASDAAKRLSNGRAIAPSKKTTAANT
ncbi:MAG: hypothetical protein E6H92_14575 [Chloroflexi bacterium]|nr:MAG: hypothetical protein E6H92_14575 [Chloroflexota bacterium]